MTKKQSLRTRLSDCIRFLWFIQDFVRHGTLYPSVKSIRPKKDRIFIIGNGPSLKSDIAPFIKHLQNEETLMVNQALTHSLAFELKPTHYLLMDPAYWGFYTHDEDTNGWVTNCITDLNKKFSQTDWQMNILAPYHFYSKRTARGVSLTNPQLKILTFNATELYTFPTLQRWFYANGFAIPSGINVLIAALCCALIMNYKKIYLLGADSNWHAQLDVDQFNRVYSLEKHYYHDDVQKVYTPYRLSFHMHCITEAFKAYDTLGMTFPHIYNLSSSSMIDAFSRSTLADIFNGGGDRVKLFWLLFLSLFLRNKGRTRC